MERYLAFNPSMVLLTKHHNQDVSNPATACVQLIAIKPQAPSISNLMPQVVPVLRVAPLFLPEFRVLLHLATLLLAHLLDPSLLDLALLGSRRDSFLSLRLGWCDGSGGGSGPRR